MKASFGIPLTVSIMGAICILAAVVSWFARIDMSGRSLEDAG